MIRAFDDVNQLAEFLRNNPSVAEAVKYVARKPKPVSSDPNEKVKETMKQFLKSKVVNGIYNDAGLMMAAEKLLIEKTPTGMWCPTKLGEKYLELLRSEQ